MACDGGTRRASMGHTRHSITVGSGGARKPSSRTPLGWSFSSSRSPPPREPTDELQLRKTTFRSLLLSANNHLKKLGMPTPASSNMTNAVSTPTCYRPTSDTPMFSLRFSLQRQPAHLAPQMASDLRSLRSQFASSLSASCDLARED